MVIKMNPTLYKRKLNFERQENHTLRSQQNQRQHAEHWCQDKRSKQHLCGLEMSQSNLQSHHCEALDLNLKTKPCYQYQHYSEQGTLIRQ